MAYDDCRSAVESTVAGLGRLDILVNNAGGSAERAEVVDSDPARWASTITANLLGIYYCTRAALPFMISARGGTDEAPDLPHEFSLGRLPPEERASDRDHDHENGGEREHRVVGERRAEGQAVVIVPLDRTGLDEFPERAHAPATSKLRAGQADENPAP
jgi:NAD(P)-dependent dehydrogenase (short-subunit alcohol dehydrogenase family)